MVTVARMGRKKLGRRPFNITLPDDVADTALRVAANEHRTAGAMVEELLRGYFRKHGVVIVAEPEKPAKRKGGAK